jgi:hypothetical protein
MYEVPRTNLHVWKCWHCREEPSAEFQLLQLLHQKLQDRPGCYVTRNALYPKLSEFDKAKTADGALVMNGVRYLLEVDNKGHLTREGRLKHSAKDEIVGEKRLRLIRVFSRDVCDFIADGIINRAEAGVIQEGEVKPLIASDAASDFYDKLYPDWELREVKDAVEEPVENPIETPEVEEVPIESLKEEFTARLEELCEFYIDVLNSNTPICKDLKRLIEVAEAIAILARGGTSLFDIFKEIPSLSRTFLYKVRLKFSI